MIVLGDVTCSGSTGSEDIYINSLKDLCWRYLPKTLFSRPLDHFYGFLWVKYRDYTNGPFVVLISKYIRRISKRFVWIYFCPRFYGISAKADEYHDKGCFCASLFPFYTLSELHCKYTYGDLTNSQEPGNETLSAYHWVSLVVRCATTWTHLNDSVDFSPN